MGAVAEDNVIPLPIRAAMTDAQKASAEMAKRVADLLLVPGKDIPGAMFEFIVEHADAHMGRCMADDAVKDAWERWSLAKLGHAEARDAAVQDLELARSQQRIARRHELLALGALECIRARVTMIDASHRRAADVATVAGKASR